MPTHACYVLSTLGRLLALEVEALRCLAATLELETRRCWKGLALHLSLVAIDSMIGQGDLGVDPDDDRQMADLFRKYRDRFFAGRQQAPTT